ncbi:PREDICTED: uncharacterized protein LOC105129006 isoform X2 [Populus euphratica]|uniref:NADH dehydrogenase [ubiquinone] 1 alpha subcomplex subunit 12 n=1 Tax=Populus euphratica TaxID=75702 RepID=A0AAJ6XSB0_POPEU|nr:PREDICTED: uncharacterized protein LOC105129006 isoform X2 [Populus euphratica]
MSKLLARIAGYLSNRTLVGVDKVGNRYFTRTEEIDGIICIFVDVSVKEKRCVIFKGEGDPTSISVEWICWLNGQRKRAPTPEEQMELEARRELVKQNVALLKQEEEERRAKESSCHKAKSTGKTGGPDLKSFIHQFPTEEKRKQGHRKQKNLCQSIQNQLDLVQPSSQGHGNHQHEMDHILMVAHIGSHFSLHHYDPRFLIGFILTRLINFTDDIVEQITYTANYFVGNFEIFGRWG